MMTYIFRLLALALALSQTSFAGLSGGGGGGGSVGTGNLTTTSTGITITGGTAAVGGSGTTINIPASDSSHIGLLSAANWSTFNAKLWNPAPVDNGTCTSTKTIDWTVSDKQYVTLGGNCTFTFTAPTSSGAQVLEVFQDGSGSHTAVWPTKVRWGNSSNTAPTLTTTHYDEDVFNFYYNAAGDYISTAQLTYVPSVTPTWAPTDYTPINLWLDGSDGASVTVASTKISQWSDKSGNSRHYTQSTAALKPTYTTAGLNGLNVVNCTNDGTTVTSQMTTAAANGTLISTSGAFTYAFVYKQTTGWAGAAGYYAPFFQPKDAAGNYLNFGVLNLTGSGFTDAFGMQDGGGSAWVNQKYQPEGVGSYHKVVITYNGSGATTAGNFALKFDGTAQSFATGSAWGAGGTGQTLCGAQTTLSSNVGFNGYIAEIIGYGRVLTSGEILILESYITDKWGI